MARLNLDENRISLIMLSAIVIVFVSLAAYVTSLAPRAFDSSVANAEQLDSQYVEKARQTVLVLDSVSREAKSLGDEIWMSGMSVGDIIAKMEDMKTTLQKEDLELKNTQIPIRFAESHEHLISATERMIRSFSSLEEAFSKFEKFDAEPPLYYVMLLLGSDATTFHPLSKMFLLNEAEKIFVNEAKLAFANSMIEAEGAEDELQLFSSLSRLNVNATSQGVAFYESYRSMPGSCAACKGPISEILKSGST